MEGVYYIEHDGILFFRLLSLPLWELNNKILDFLQVKSKLEVLASYADAKIGLVTHGWITKIEKHGCFVRFYNGVQGFVSRLTSHFLMKFISYMFLTCIFLSTLM